MAVSLCIKGRMNANALIGSGKVDKSSAWSFSAEDGNSILGDPPDWKEYQRWFLGVDNSADPETKEHYKYPFGKDGKLYRSGLIAIRQRASQQNEQDIFDTAGAMLGRIDDQKSSAQEHEKRTFQFSLIPAGEARQMVGHAAVFGQPTDIGGWFTEQVEPGAFTSSIQEDDVRALWNHNPDYILGRNTSGTLVLSEDKTGLKVSIEPPDTQFARDLAVSIERGDINQMSFAFQVLAEEWIKGEGRGQDLRKIKKVRLFDVSPVTFPAYEGTDIALRSHDAWAEAQAMQDPPEHPAAYHDGNLSLQRQLIGRM